MLNAWTNNLKFCLAWFEESHERKGQERWGSKWWRWKASCLPKLSYSIMRLSSQARLHAYLFLYFFLSLFLSFYFSFFLYFSISRFLSFSISLFLSLSHVLVLFLFNLVFLFSPSRVFSFYNFLVLFFVVCSFFSSVFIFLFLLSFFLLVFINVLCFLCLSSFLVSVWIYVFLSLVLGLCLALFLCCSLSWFSFLSVLLFVVLFWCFFPRLAYLIFRYFSLLFLLSWYCSLYCSFFLFICRSRSICFALYILFSLFISLSFFVSFYPFWFLWLLDLFACFVRSLFSYNQPCLGNHNIRLDSCTKQN